MTPISCGVTHAGEIPSPEFGESLAALYGKHSGKGLGKGYDLHTAYGGAMLTPRIPRPNGTFGNKWFRETTR